MISKLTNIAMRKFNRRNLKKFTPQVKFFAYYWNEIFDIYLSENIFYLKKIRLI